MRRQHHRRFGGAPPVAGDAGYQVAEDDPALSEIVRAVRSAGLTPSLQTTGGGSDANVFFEQGIAALPVGIGVRDFHTTRETASISAVCDAARVCAAYISGGDGE